MTITLAMIVCDEEERLAAFLESARDLYDELVIVDTGSTDRTVQIAEAHRARVFSFPWCDDFAAARNESIRHATADWVVWLDADDRLPAGAAETLRREAEAAPEDVVAFCVRVFSTIGGQRTGRRPSEHLKLFRNHRGICFAGRLHERIDTERLAGKVILSEAEVLHLGYDPEHADQAAKRARNLRIVEANERSAAPDILTDAAFASELLEAGDDRAAMPYLDRFLGRPSDEIPARYLPWAWNARTLVYLRANNLPLFSEHAMEGLRRFPDNPDTLFAAGLAYGLQQQVPGVLRCLIACVEADRSQILSAVDWPATLPLIYYLIGSTFKQVRQFADARRWLQRGADAGNKEATAALLMLPGSRVQFRAV